MDANSGLGMSRRMLDMPDFAATFDAVETNDAGVLWRASHLRALSSVIEGDIIPRLLLAHGGGLSPPPAAPSRTVGAADVAEFADLLLSQPTERCIRFAERLVAEGVALEGLFLALFAPTARALGVFWTEDVRTFTDVTIALVSLQQVLRHFTPRFDEELAVVVPRHALLFPAPGEQHTFGLFMVEMFLHRAGWEVDALPIFDANEVQECLRHGAVDVVGISCSCERFVDGLDTAVRLVRRAATAGLPVIGGGQAFLEQPRLGAEVGLDAVAIDAHAAVDTASRLVQLGDPRRRLS